MNCFTQTEITFEENFREVNIFIEEAQKAFNSAQSEVNLAQTVWKSVSRIKAKKHQNLRSITVWHYQNAVEKFNLAIKNLEQANYFNALPKHKEFIKNKMDKLQNYKELALVDKGKLEFAV